MYMVEDGLCTGCGVCLSLCCSGAVSLRRDIAFIDQQRCGACGTCFDMCRQSAVYEPNKPRRAASRKVPMYVLEDERPSS
jgi:uncharacterized Fe-S center protein